MPYKEYAKYLKWLCLILLAYVLTGLFIELDWRAVLRHSVFPALRFDRDEIFLVTGILGTTISPYLFFWQTSQEVEEEILAGKTTLAARQEVTRKDIRKMRADIWTGMFVSNLVMFFIIAVSAAVLWQNGIRNITTAAEAALALRPLAGDAASLLFAMGVIGTGLLAVPVLAASASYAIAESLRWREGLSRKFHQAQAFYTVIIVSVLVGLGLNFVGIDPIKALIYAAVANGIVAPAILVVVVGLASNKKIMGEAAASAHTAGWGWVVVGLMTAAAIATLISLLIPLQ